MATIHYQLESSVVPDAIARAVVLPASYGDLDRVVYPACEWLRHNAPVARAEVEGYDPLWLISKHAQIKEVLRDAETFHNADANIMLQPQAGDAYLRELLDGTTHVLSNLSYMEPPEHGRYRDDLSTSIVTARLEDGELMPERIQNHLTASIALAGHDATNSAISAGMHGLALFPAQFDKVKADPSLVPGLVEESLRWATPAKHFMRNASRDTEVAGVPIKSMDRLMCLFVSGNRDEAAFPDPMSFDVTRRPNPHLSYSFGPHVCLGQHIAKIDEMRALFDELIPRLGSVELAGEPRLKVSNFVSGFKSLPIRFTKA